MKLIVLIDNKAKEDLFSEWGLAVYIEYNGWKVLLDTGASHQFANNADILGVDLEQIDFAVLSHAHYDHADGIPAFFERNHTAPLYLSSSVAENCYSMSSNEMKYIGIAPGTLERYASRIKRVSAMKEVAAGVYVLPHCDASLCRIGEENGMYVQRNGGWEADDFSHEQSLIFDTPRGLFVLNSCSHAGVEHIVREVSETLPGKKIYGLFGGLHLFQKTEAEVLEQSRLIRNAGIEMIYTGHCTGDAAVEVLKRELGESVQIFYAGMELMM